MSPDPDFAWLEEIALAGHADGAVVQAGGVAVVVRRRPTLLDLVRDAWPRIERMGVDAIAQAHAAGVPAWVSEGGTIWRLDPDGTRHVETRSAEKIAATARPARREALRAYERALHATRYPARDRTRGLRLGTEEQIEAAAVRIARDRG